MAASANKPFAFITFPLLIFMGHMPVQGQTGETDNLSFPKLQFRKWSGDINVPDPVSVSVDDQGKVYATQTRRRKIQDLDIREHTQWIPNDVGLSSVQQKEDFLKKQLAIGGDQDYQRKHVLDLNKDGQHDWRDLQVVSEVIYQLTDTDDDGTADQMTVFAEDFRTPVTGIAAGVLAYGGDVWATIAPDVWKLTDTDADGVADQRQVMAHGFGIHIAYAGHDMHGLTVGPDGKIYWSIGDKGINVTSPEGRHYFYPNQGGVMRCNPDGSDFEVFAHGLRNVQELAFDKYGNLFGVDNDADQPNEKERFVYIVNGMDAGWRCNYQYRGNQYNPWTDEKLWDMPGENHPAYIVPPLSHYVDGPAGFVYNPGTALAPQYYDFFFLTSAPNGQQYAFRAQPDGDAFKMVDQHQIGSGIAIVGWNWGPDGALYGADWDGGYPLDEKGSVVRMDVASEPLPIREEVRQLLGKGFAELSVDSLTELLGHQDQRVRLYAQFELVNRRQLESLQRVANTIDADPLARVHAIWGLGQLGRAGEADAAATIVSQFSDRNAQLRGQAVKTYGELPKVSGLPLIPLLEDSDDHVRTLVALALARQPSDLAVPVLLRQAALLKTEQHYLRHAHALALGQCATAEQLSELQQRSASKMQRLCCVLALRHQASPAIASYLHDRSDWIVTEAARAIHDDFSIEAALPELAASLNQRLNQTEAFSRRAINANFRLGTEQAALQVLTFARDSKRPMPMRLEAVQALSHWKEHEALDRVDGRNRHLQPRSLDPSIIENDLALLAQNQNSQLRTEALRAARAMNVPLSDAMLIVLVKNEAFADDLRATALESLTGRTKSKELAQLCHDILQGKTLLLRKQALATLGQLDPPAAIAAANRLIQDDTAAVPLRQSAIRSLANLPGSEPLLNQMLEQYLRADNSLDSRLALDLFQTLQLDDRIQNPKEIDLRSLARDGGDARQGELIFRTHQQAQCIRCHRVGGQGSDIGPELSQIGSQRDADYLLRAIVNPSADIDDKYRTQLYLLDSGQLIKGVPLRESGSEITVADSEGKEIAIPKEEILENKVQTTSLMPNMEKAITPSELRDLVAYLRSLKATK